MSERLHTTREVAELLGVCPDTILRRLAAGKITGYRLASNALRFRDRDIEAYLERIREGDEGPGLSSAEEA